ncbi:CcdB family protein [Sulfuricurvum sp.]|uniref:CcdB family protein n=1 Tax=Sulfuricurvum sp. TaxID=2025608 RepID=UPI00261B63E2|nr:CcdB family protein [Sulfuricurvum sp.]MDD2837700.1 CcdB family protein [Sulfuricurvum sp.]MDD3597053.1 CcdB family protein [Sulfuricurvum sp.]
MAQFDVYRNPNPESNTAIPYLLDIQTDLLSVLTTCVVVPLTRQENPIKHLNPLFEINGENIIMLTQEIAGIERAALGEKISSLKEYRSKIIPALDFLVSGF